MTHPGELLSAFLDGELSPAERVTVAAHLDSCPECHEELGHIDTARSAVRSLPLLEPPAGLVPGFAGTTRAPVLRRAWVWATSGAVAAGLAAAIMIAPGQPPAAFDLDSISDQHTARLVVEPGFATVRAPVADR